MGKTRPPERSKLARKQKKHTSEKKRRNRQSPEELLQLAVAHLQQSEPDTALNLATVALTQLKETLRTDEDVISCLPALMILGEINVELGDIEAAREYFSQAAQIDEDGDIPEERGGGADKFLWLAQLSDEGGADSVRWFEKGAEVLRQEIKALEEDVMDNAAKEGLEERKDKLANALCAIAEVYMTDLSWDDAKAEEVCNKVTEEALQVAPNNPETLQTVASVRISQGRRDEAKEYLQKSLSLWKDLPPDSEEIPDFAIRISLARLLMEAEIEDEALDVIERLLQEDDHSIETWYLGGWCLHLLAEKQKNATNGKSDGPSSETLELMKRARTWLLRCLKLYALVGYEDDRLKEHAEELVRGLNAVLGEPEDEAEDAEEDDVWEDDEDEEMEES